MIDKMTHYSMQNYPTIFDEEALTALELAARTAGKMNECIGVVNDIPNTVNQNVEEHIQNGSFDTQINKYSGNMEKALSDHVQDMNAKVGALEAETGTAIKNTNDALGSRIDNLAKLGAGSTTGDAELIDARVDYWGSPYTNAGGAIRGGQQYLYSRAKNYFLGIQTQSDASNNHKIVFDTVNRVVTTEIGCYYQSQYGPILVSAGTTGVIPSVAGNYHMWVGLDADNKSYFYFVGKFDPPNGKSDIYIGMVYLNSPDTDGKIPVAYMCVDNDLAHRFVVDGKSYVEQAPTPANAIDCDNAVINIDTKSDETKITVSVSGTFFFDKLGYKIIDATAETTVSAANNRTWCIVLEGSGNLVWRWYFQKSRADREILQLWIEGGVVKKIIAPPTIRKVVTINGLKVLSGDSIKDYSKGLPAIFNKVVCCGDSNTSGNLIKPDGTVEPNCDWAAYPAHLQKMHGGEWLNCARSGATAKSWLTDTRGLTRAKEIGKVQAYLVALGHNEYSTDFPIGTIADIGTAEESFYRYYAEVVAQLRAISPDAHIFVFTSPADRPTISAPIVDVANYFNNSGDNKVHLLRGEHLSAYWWGKDTETTNHPSVIGQKQIANMVSEVMDNYMLEHCNLFDDVPFIECD